VDRKGGRGPHIVGVGAVEGGLELGVLGGGNVIDPRAGEGRSTGIKGGLWVLDTGIPAVACQTARQRDFLRPGGSRGTQIIGVKIFAK